MNRFVDLWLEDNGQSLTEYSLLVGAFVIAVLGALRGRNPGPIVEN